jgi:hypothetical protein
VTDNQGWRPPASPAPDASGSNPWAVPAPAAPAAQQQPAWQHQQQQAPGWTPPPKPGLIPLHPLSFGTIIGSSFRVMRRNPAPTFGLSVLIYGLVTIVYVGLLFLLLATSLGRLSTATASDQADILAGSVGLIALSTLVPASLALTATAILQAIISLEVSRATLGEKLKVRGLWRLAKGRIGTMVLWALLLTAFIVVFVLSWSVATGLALAAATAASSVNDSVLAFFGSLAVMLVLGLGFGAVAAWLGIKTSLVPSVVMLERLSLFASVRRSWQLTRGSFWRTLGAQLLIGVIIYAATYVVSIPITVIGYIILGLTNPTGDSDSFILGFAVMYIVIGAVTVVVGAVGLVMQSASLSLIYIDIRMRKEGLDLELLRYVEARQRGGGGVENPYLRLQGAATAPSAPAGSPWA